MEAPVLAGGPRVCRSSRLCVQTDGRLPGRRPRPVLITAGEKPVKF